jgi:uncharacterized MAPEG superfamily protein
MEGFMNDALTLVLYFAIVTWLLSLAAGLVRAQGWTPAGMVIAFGNRDNLPVLTPLTGRMERTWRNSLENLVYFAVLALIAHVMGDETPRESMGAEVFFWARIVYIPVYYLGIIYLRTLVWLVSVIGLAMMLMAVL